MSRLLRWFPAVFAGVLVAYVALAAGLLVSHWRHTGRLLEHGDSSSLLVSGRQAAMARAVGPLLERRSQAVLSHDRATFLRTVDPAAAEFGRKQSRLQQRLTDLPFHEWSYRVAAVPRTSSALAEQLRRRYGAPIWITAVTLRYSFSNVSQFAVTRTQYLTFVLRNGAWRIGNDNDLARQGLHTARELWDFAPVEFVRNGPAVIIGYRAHSDMLQDLSRIAARVHESVAELFPRWAGPLVVMVPPDGTVARTLLPRSNGVGAQHLSRLSAVTTTEMHENQFDAEGARVIVNPEVLVGAGDQEREVVLRHEAAHVASRAITSSTTPLWLSEGIAEYAALRRNAAPPQRLAPELTALIRRGDAPTALPNSADFVADTPSGSTSVAVAYRQAWAACLVITQRIGTTGLVQFYERMGESSGSTWPDSARSVLSLSQGEFVALWREYIVETFG